jgi:hypothetical protein
MRIVDHKSRFKKIRFVSWSQIQSIFKRFELFSQIQRILTNPWYYSTKWILKNQDLQISNPYESRLVDLQIQILKIRFMDLFWKKNFPNYSICFVSEGFIYDSRILNIWSNDCKFKNLFCLKLNSYIRNIFYYIVVKIIQKVLIKNFFSTFCTCLYFIMFYDLLLLHLPSNIWSWQETY